MALFVEVAKRKSFSQAAAALDVPISSLSRRITQFEASIGLRLLDRTTRKLVLTPYGEAYYEQAIRLVEEAQRCFDDLVAQARGPSGLLRISAPPEAWALRHLPDVIAAFLRTHEHVRIHVDLRMPGSDLMSEGCDLAIVMEEPRETAVIARPIGQLSTGLFAAPSYLARAGAPRHPDDLAHQQHTLLVAASGSTPLVLARAGESVTVTAGGAVSCNSLPLAQRFAAAGHGLVLLPEIDAAAEMPALQRVLPDWSGPPVPVAIVTTSRLIPARARAFIDVGGRHLAALLSLRGSDGAEGEEAADLSPLYAWQA